MFPNFTLPDAADMTAREMELMSHCMTRQNPLQSTDSENICLSQGRHPVACATRQPFGMSRSSIAAASCQAFGIRTAIMCITSSLSSFMDLIRHVVSLRSAKQVIRPHTCSDIAVMAGLQIWGKRTMGNDVGKAMCAYALITPNTKTAIAIRHDLALPQPASICLVNIGPKARDNIRGKRDMLWARHARLLLSRVMFRGGAVLEHRITSIIAYFALPVLPLFLLGASLQAVNSTAPRVVTVSDATSLTCNADTTDVCSQTNTQSAGTLTANAPTGTPSDGQVLIIRVKTTNAQNWSWNAVFRGSTDTALPTTTTAGKWDYIAYRWNSTDSKFDCNAVSRGY
jgi:hypothetical protein